MAVLLKEVNKNKKTIRIGSVFNISDSCSNFVDGICSLDPERHPSCIGQKEFCFVYVDLINIVD